jgi:hypothetical protein
MAYFTKLDTNNIVLTVVAVHNNELLDSEGVEQETNGVNFLRTLYNESTAVWKQTSYNTLNGVHYTVDENGDKTPSIDQTKALRKNYAGIGYTYDENRDAFIPLKPKDKPSWVINETTCQWEAPVPKPTEVLPANQVYGWNEETLSWDVVIKEEEEYHTI